MLIVLNLSELERKDILESYKIIKKNQDFFVIRFYHYFFQTNAKNLFKDTKMEKQYVMFSKSLDLIISQILNPDKLFNQLKIITKSHTAYGVLVTHSPYFIDSFMQALKEIFTEKKDTDLLNLWSVLLSDLMDYFNKGINELQQE